VGVLAHRCVTCAETNGGRVRPPYGNRFYFCTPPKVGTGGPPVFFYSTTWAGRPCHAEAPDSPESRHQNPGLPPSATMCGMNRSISGYVSIARYTPAFENHPGEWVLTLVLLSVVGLLLARWLLKVVGGFFVRWPMRTRLLREQRGQCPRCGYSLYHNQSGVCPECGEARNHRPG